MVEEKEGFKGLHSMIPVSVHDDLMQLIEQRKSFVGSWDLGSVLRELLESHKVKMAVERRLEEMETRISMIENSGASGNVPVEEKVTELLGGHKVVG